MTTVRHRDGRRVATVVVAAIYGFSIAILFVAEVSLGRAMPRADFGQYTLARNALPLTSVLTLLGVDQALTREYSAGRMMGTAGVIWFRRLPAAVLVGGLTSLTMYLWLGVGFWTALAVWIAAPALVTSDLTSGLLRGNGSYSGAALVQQGYRLCLGSAAVVVTVFALVTGQSLLAFALCAMVGGTMGFAAIGLKQTEDLRIRFAGKEDVAYIERLGIAFGLSMLSLAALDWLDQALVTSFGPGLRVTGEYAAQKLLAVYPLLSISSVLGFVVMPEMVKIGHTITQERLRRWFSRCAIGSAVLAAIWYAGVNLTFPIIFRYQPDPKLLTVLVIAGGVRLFYLLPSSVLGAVGSTTLIMKTSIWGLTAVVALPSLSWAFMQLRLSAPLAVGLALCASLGLRTLVACVGASRAVTCPRVVTQ